MDEPGRSQAERNGPRAAACTQISQPNRCGCIRVGAILFVSGHPPQHPDMKIRDPGKLGADMTIEEGYAAASPRR